MARTRTLLAPAAGRRLPPELLALVAQRFAALADPNRLALLQILCEREAGVQELADETGIGQSSASRHLAHLAAQGFLTRRREGASAIYAIADDTPKALCELICEHLALEARRLAGVAVPAARGRRR